MHAPDTSSQLDGQRPASLRAERALLPAGILAATFLAYAATLSFGFVFDDSGGIVRNDSIRSWHFVPGYFTSHVWSFLYPHLLSNYYRPLFLLWLRLNDSIFGLHPWGWHLTSVLLHLGVTGLVYRLGIRSTRDPLLAAVAALVFGLHPVHIEAVAYVSAVPELLSALFLLAALLAWVRSWERGFNPRWLAGALALYSAALLSKESGMMLPIFIALYAWLHPSGEGEEGSAGKRLGATLAAIGPFLVVTLAYLPLRIWALKGFAHTVTPVELGTEIFTIPSVVSFYLRLLVWPLRLSCYYDTPYVTSATFDGFFVPLVIVLAVVGGLASWYLWLRRFRPVEAGSMAFAALWMACAILPVLNFRLLPAGEIAHDRYLYLPSVGFSLLVAMALRVPLGQQERRPRPAWAIGVAVVACLLMGAATLQQSLYWSDNLSLNYRAHQLAPDNVSATTSLAAAVAERGMAGTAMALYQQALAIQPDFWRANVNLAYLYYAQGNFPEAAQHFARACAADPTDGDQFLYLGMSLLRLGKLDLAEQAVRSALLVRPHGKEYHLGLGMVLKGEGRLPEAKKEIESELTEYPGNAQAQALLNELSRQIEAPKGETGTSLPPHQDDSFVK